MKRILLLSLLMMMGTLQQALAQDRTVSGTVTSAEDNSPLPGVSVVVKGSSNGTATNADGAYSLSVPSGATLVFSFIGLQSQEVAVGNQTTINVAMTADVKQLSEVVITAVGIERSRKSLGYVVQEVKGEQLAQRAEPDVLRALNGKVAGVQITGSNGAPGSSTNVVIRGYNSTRNNQPLFVVDGVPFDNTTNTTDNTLISGSSYSNRLTDISPADIESMTVLKGGAAAALYGSRAANGVIVITTKAGSKGLSQKGLEVTFNSSYTMQEVAKLPNYQNQYGQGNEGKFVNGNFGNWGPAFADLDSVTDFRGNRVPYRAYPNNVKDFYRTGSIVENSLGVSTGNSKYNFFTSFNRLKQEGTIPNTDYARTNISVGGNVKLDNGFTAGGSLSFANVMQTGPQLGGGGIADASVHRVLWYIPRSFDLSGYPSEDPTTGASIYFRPDVLNPYWVSKNNPYTSNVDRISGNLNMSYDILDWLNVSYKIGINTYVDLRKQGYARGNPLSPTGGVTLDNIRYREVESNLLLTATKNLTENIGLRAILGHNINQRLTDRQSVAGTNLIVPGIVDIDNTGSLVPNGGEFSKRRLYGVFADVQLSYRDYLYLTLTGRNDWSSTLPKANNNFFYPAASVAFIFSDALGIKSNVLSSGKIRAGVSRVANDATAYAIQNVFNGNSTNGNNLASVTPPFRGQSTLTASDVLGNPNIRPEFTNEIEVGTDLSFLDNRATLNFTYYHKKTTDLITSVDIPSTSGYIQQLQNAGEILNRGVEIGLNLDPVRTSGGFNWNIFVNYTRNISKVIALAQNQEFINVPGQSFSNPRQIIRVGGGYGEIYGTALARDAQGNLLINPVNGYPIATAASQVIGDPNPDFLLAITNTFTYKGLSLSFLADAKVGGDLYIGTVQDMRARGVLQETAADRDKARLIPGVLGNPNTRQPLLDGEGRTIPNTLQISANEYWFNGPPSVSDESAVFDGTVFRLRELTLGYQLPKGWLNKTPIGSATISLVGRNLWFYTPNIPQDAAIDPETSGQGAGNLQALIQNYVPNNKSYGVNLRLTF